MESISLFAAFLAGIISFISPCVLPLIPMYISFISGLSLDEMKGDNDRKRILKKVLISSVLFVIGFSVIFIGLGASSTFLGKFLLSRLSLFSKIAGAIIIILGLHVAGVFKLAFLNYEKRFHFKNKPVGSFSPIIAGLAFGFGWTPCVGPVLGTILLYSSSKDTVSQGISLLSMYSLGLGIPFIITGISINAFFIFLQKIKKYYRYIEIFIGICLVIMGILILLDAFSIIAEYISRWFPWLVVG